jgi:hypothetical protein
MVPLRGVHLGQAEQALADFERRSLEAIAKYQALLKRAALVKDDKVRGGIVNWIGSASVPGSPADRYQHVKDESDQGAPWDEIRTGHLDDLEAVNQEFETRVQEGEKSGVILGPSPASVLDDQGKLTTAGAALVLVAAGALFAVTLAFR